MELKNKSILLVSPEPWAHIFVSKHHYAIQLAKNGNNVFFLNPPSTEKKIESTAFLNVSLVNYKGFPAGLRFFPRYWQRLITKRAYRALERLCSVRFDVIWSFDNSVFFDFSALPAHVLKISHIVDLNQDFQTGKAAATADFCFCNSEFIKARLSRFCQNVFKITHGFNDVDSECQAPVTQLVAKVKVIYAGNLAMPYIDWCVIDVIVRENPDVDFFFLGPDAGLPGKSSEVEAKIRVKRQINAHFLGPIASHCLQGYYRQADILVLAYQEKHHREQANPHKMMEYLGSGKMIIATYTAEFFQVSSSGLFLMTKKNSDFPGAFKRVLGELDHWNSDALQYARKEFAIDNSYQRQLARIQKIIQ